MTRVNNGLVAGISNVPVGAGINTTHAVYEANSRPALHTVASHAFLGSGAGIDFGTPWKSPFSFTALEDAKAEEEAHEPGAGYIH